MNNPQRTWWKEAVIYQVYPRSFADSDGDGIGDLPGITEHLPYLKELGIDVIWLSPVYASPCDDNGYDISDYRAILPAFGTMEDFDRLLETAHGMGIRIVMDLVVNHTSDEHPWFIESRKSTDNPFRDYYIWKEPRRDASGQVMRAPDGTPLPPNNWASFFSGSAWEYDPETEMFYLHLFSRKQPDLNWENPAVRREVYDMMTWWCEKGIDGFRMDVISMISKDPAYPDGEVLDGLYGKCDSLVVNGPHVHEYLQEMNREVLSRYDLLTVGETAGVTIEEARRYASKDGKELSMVFHFEHVDGHLTDCILPGCKWTTERPSMPALREVLNKWQLGLEGEAWGSLYWDNHDQPRAVSQFGDARPEWRVLSAKMLAANLHMMKGTPYIYQGEELGMTNTHFESIEDCRDIEVLNAYRQYVVDHHILPHDQIMACFDVMSRDNARTPMQWSDAPNAGFTTGEPWIAVNPNYTEINAQACLEDPDSVFRFYQELIRLRKEHPVIVYGDFRPLMMDSDAVYAYKRVLAEEPADSGCPAAGGAKDTAGTADILTVACNWTDRPQPCTLFECTPERPEGAGTELLSNYSVHQPGLLQPYEARIFLRSAPAEETEGTV